MKIKAADIATILLSALWLTPLIVAVLLSFRPPDEPLSNGNIFVGSHITLDNYISAWAVAPWLTHYRNSVIFVVGVLAVQVVTITLAGYAFARMKFFGRDILLIVILLQLMIPSGVLIVQNFATVRQLGLFDTHIALMLPYWGCLLYTSDAADE